MPQPPKPHPVPLPKQGHDYGHFNAFRDLQRELDDLSDEENAIEDMVRVLSLLALTSS